VLAISTTGWWVIGAIVAAGVVLVAALLLLAIIALARRIVRQAGAIVSALDGARANTDALYDVTTTNHAIDRITRNLAAVREGLEP
jgi:hypothetical protein